MTKSTQPPNGVRSYGSRPNFAEGQPNDNRCPRHGDRYVIRRGTNQCPKGRKQSEICR